MTPFGIQDINFRRRYTGQFARFLSCLILLFRSNYGFRANQFDLVGSVTGGNVGPNSRVYTTGTNNRQGRDWEHNLPLAG